MIYLGTIDVTSNVVKNNLTCSTPFSLAGAGKILVQRNSGNWSVGKVVFKPGVEDASFLPSASSDGFFRPPANTSEAVELNIGGGGTLAVAHESVNVFQIF